MQGGGVRGVQGGARGAGGCLRGIGGVGELNIFFGAEIPTKFSELCEIFSIRKPKPWKMWHSDNFTKIHAKFHNNLGREKRRNFSLRTSQSGCSDRREKTFFSGDFQRAKTRKIWKMQTQNVESVETAADLFYIVLTCLSSPPSLLTIKKS